MSKYRRLTEYLESLGHGTWSLSFTEIERILGFALPDSARNYSAWWDNKSVRHSHALSWSEPGWKTQDLNLGAERVTFSRELNSESRAFATTPVPYPSMGAAPITYSWDVLEELACELRLCWTHIGAVTLDREMNLIFPKVPSVPGLYRFRIRSGDGGEQRYVGESENLYRRLSQYRTPGPQQQTNIRMNRILVAAFRNGAQVSLSTVADRAWISEDGIKKTAPLTNGAVRRLFESLAQVIEKDDSFESLNR